MPPPVRPRPGQKPQPNSSIKFSGGNNSKLALIIILCTVTVGVAAYFAYSYFNPKPKFIVYDQPKTTPADSLQQNVTDSTSMVESTSPVPDQKPEPSVKHEPSTSVPKGCYIIVGSFKNKNNAERMTANLKKDYVFSVLYFEESGLYRVSAGHYDDLRKAYNDTYSIKDLDGCANAWVLENR